MSKITRRGYVSTDEKEFRNRSLSKLYSIRGFILFIK